MASERRRLHFLIASAAVALTFAWISTLRHRRKPGPVRIAYLPIYVQLPIFVAEERGLFRKHGVAVELVRFTTSPDIATSLVTGAVQFADIAYSSTLTVESRDPGKLKVFMVDSETPAGYLSSFVVLADSGIKSLRDLRNKTIASFPGPTALTFCKMVLEKNGLDPEKDLKIIELDITSHLAALESRRVDALFTYEPTATQAVLEKKAVKLLPGAVESQILNPWQAGTWVIAAPFLAARPEDARKVMASLYEAVDYIRANPTEAKQYLNTYTSIKPEVARATPDIPVTKPGEIDLAAFQRQADILFQRGVVSKKITAAALLLPPEPADGRGRP